MSIGKFVRIAHVSVRIPTPDYAQITHASTLVRTLCPRCTAERLHGTRPAPQQRHRKPHVCRAGNPTPAHRCTQGTHPESDAQRPLHRHRPVRRRQPRRQFSAASLEQLEEFGLVSGASAISGVSGGAIAGGYYALHGKQTNWPLLRSKLKTDFFGQTILKPANLTTMLLTNKTRTSFLSDVLDDVLYDKKTYQDLPHDGPIFLANATDATDGGKRVVFSYEYFYGTLHSPIQDIRLATAVATSAAFPGVFDSVTFERFRPKNSFVPELGSESRESPSYVHLFDGGAADNLGVETLWDVALTQLYGNDMAVVPPRLNSKPFILIAIDANAPNSSAVFEKMSDERQPLDRIFNKNIYDAVDALFSRQRKENLVKMGFGQARFDTITHEKLRRPEPEIRQGQAYLGLCHSRAVPTPSGPVPL